MNDVELNRYYEDTFSLVRTMVIKMDEVALRDNLVLTEAGYGVSSDKTTWRYYMNLNGDYHPTDDVMVVTSIDTGEDIAFTKANLVSHIKTAREYNKAGATFNRLMETYPHQPTLIRGILSPIPYAETIDAKDYKILNYNKSLVLWNEYQLIPKLQEHVDSIVPQLFKTDYMVTDDLWLPLMIKKLTASLIEVIHTIRIEAVYTRHTHEFFIWSHIDSFGDFAKYKNSLSRTQTMWLFRNIAWLKNNPGQQYTLNKLMVNILTPANVPLSKYDMVETTTTQLVDLTPTPLYRRLHMNLVEDYGRAPNFITTEELTYKQRLLAKDNPDQQLLYQADALAKGTFSLHSELPTKALESAMRDYTNRHIDTLMSTVLNNWIYLAGKNVYKGKVVVVDPKTGKQARLNADDAYNVWRYLVSFSRGQYLVDIPEAYYQNVMRLTPPSIAQLINLAGPAFLTPKFANDIRQHWVDINTFVSPDALIKYAFDVYAAMWKHKKMYSQFYDLNKRARVQNAVKSMYTSGVIKLGSYTTYQALLDTYEFDFTDYTAEEARNFAWDIFKRLTSWENNQQQSLRTKQSDLIDIMTSLSSYTIHVIKEMDDGTDSTELINDMFIGDPRWIGEGNGSYGDYSNVIMNTRTTMDGIRCLESLTVIRDTPEMKLISEAVGFAKLISGDYFKPVNLSNNLLDYAVKFPTTDYLRVLPVDP